MLLAQIRIIDKTSAFGGPALTDVAEQTPRIGYPWNLENIRLLVSDDGTLLCQEMVQIFIGVTEVYNHFVNFNKADAIQAYNISPFQDVLDLGGQAPMFQGQQLSIIRSSITRGGLAKGLLTQVQLFGTHS